MITFILAVILLIAGYFIYGKFVARFFGASSKILTPVKRLADGVDYQELKSWRIFVIQFLNIAGLGPIFGAILGAAYGPMAFLWIVVGCIFMGATHDYFSGMLSVRHNGMSLPDIVGKYLGNGMKKFMVVFTGVLLLAVGVSFVNGPADLLSNLTGWSMNFWLYVIFVYYILATLLPVNKIIGKIYPFMGAALIFMALGIGGAMLYRAVAGDLEMTELTWGMMRNMHDHPETNLLFPMLFVVVCPVTSGDTAFRSMRLILADALRFTQKPIRNRLIISVPVFVVAYFLCNFDFSTLWKYVGISNQVLATITLWAGASYLVQKEKPHWMLSVPAAFLTSVCVTYFLVAPYKVGGLNLGHDFSYITGGMAAMAVFAFFLVKKKNGKCGE